MLKKSLKNPGIHKKNHSRIDRFIFYIVELLGSSLYMKKYQTLVIRIRSQTDLRDNKGKAFFPTSGLEAKILFKPCNFVFCQNLKSVVDYDIDKKCLVSKFLSHKSKQ